MPEAPPRFPSVNGVAGIVLAAGRGTRFGDEPKLLADVRGKPMVRRAVEAALGAGLFPVVVVVGHRAAQIGGAMTDLAVGLVENPSHAEGLSTSLRAGFATLPRDAIGAVVLLGDMPEIGPDLIRTVVAGWETAGRPAAAVPTHDGRRGNPVLLSIELRTDIESLQGDAGAGALLRAHSDVVEIPVLTDAVLLDVDTPGALAGLGTQAPASTTPSRMAE